MLSEEVRNTQRLLDELVGATAILWRYVASHSVLEVRLIHDEREGNVHLIMEGCGRIESPPAWKGACLTVREHLEGDGSSVRVVVEDEHAGFRVACGLVMLQNNVEPVHSS